MWKKPWGYKEGFICGAGLFVTGLLLQWSVGGIRWACLHGRSISLFWCCSCCCWQGCMGFANGCIVSDGSVIIRLQFLPWSVWRLSLSLWLVRQVPSTHPSADVIGFSKMLSFWPFVLLYVWLVAVLGMTILRAAIPSMCVRFLFC